MTGDLLRASWKMLLDATRDSHPIVRSEAARLLGGIGDPRAVPSLARMLERDRTYSKITAIYALGEIRDRKALPVLRPATGLPLRRTSPPPASSARTTRESASSTAARRLHRNTASSRSMQECGGAGCNRKWHPAPFVLRLRMPG